MNTFPIIRSLFVLYLFMIHVALLNWIHPHVSQNLTISVGIPPSSTSYIFFTGYSLHFLPATFRIKGVIFLDIPSFKGVIFLSRHIVVQRCQVSSVTRPTLKIGRLVSMSRSHLDVIQFDLVFPIDFSWLYSLFCWFYCQAVRFEPA